MRKQGTKQKTTLNNLNIALLNIRSLRNKLHELEILLNEQKQMPKIIIITESWLRKEDVQFYNLNGYSTVASCRENNRGGGILMFIHESIKYNEVKNVNFDKNHLIIIHLTEIDLKICGFYKSPATNQDNLLF